VEKDQKIKEIKFLNKGFEAQMTDLRAFILGEEFSLP
jgi:hypothetical protein